MTQADHRDLVGTAAALAGLKSQIGRSGGYPLVARRELICGEDLRLKDPSPSIGMPPREERQRALFLRTRDGHLRFKEHR
jgi:hypothetical protein